jgi:hypothetical protein
LWLIHISPSEQNECIFISSVLDYNNDKLRFEDYMCFQKITRLSYLQYDEDIESMNERRCREEETED